MNFKSALIVLSTLPYKMLQSKQTAKYGYKCCCIIFNNVTLCDVRTQSKSQN